MVSWHKLCLRVFQSEKEAGDVMIGWRLSCWGGKGDGFGVILEWGARLTRGVSWR